MKPVIFDPEAKAELDGAIGWYNDKQDGLGLIFRTKCRRQLPARRTMAAGGSLILVDRIATHIALSPP